MQFHHAHGFRPQVGEVLERGVAGGATTRGWRSAPSRSRSTCPASGRSPAGTGPAGTPSNARCGAAAATCPGLSVRQGHVDGVAVAGRPGRAASSSTAPQRRGRPRRRRVRPVRPGRRRRAGARRRSAACAAWRTSTASTGSTTGRSRGRWPTRSPGRPTSTATRCIVFLHERGHFSVLLVRPTADAALKDLRHEAAFEAACRAIPGLAEWTDPDRARAGHRRPAGRPAAQRLPRAARPSTAGRAARARQRRRRGRDHHPDLRPRRGHDVPAGPAAARPARRRAPTPRLVGEPFDAWCDEQHAAVGARPRAHGRRPGPPLAGRRRRPDPAAAVGPDPGRGRGGPADRRRPARATSPCCELPSCLDPVEPLARAVYESGWRPAYSPGPPAANCATSSPRPSGRADVRARLRRGPRSPCFGAASWSGEDGPAGEEVEGLLGRGAGCGGEGDEGLAGVAGELEAFVVEGEVAGDGVVEVLGAGGVPADVVGGPEGANFSLRVVSSPMSSLSSGRRGSGRPRLGAARRCRRRPGSSRGRSRWPSGRGR